MVKMAAESGQQEGYTGQDRRGEKHKDVWDRTGVSPIALMGKVVTHIVRAKTPNPTPSDEFKNGSYNTYREGIQLAVRRVQGRYHQLAIQRMIEPSRRSTVKLDSYVIEVGVPLRYIATKICALFCGGIRPLLTMACTTRMPMIGNNTIFATQTEMIAAIGKREIGRGIFILAKEEPRSTRESGIEIAPMKEAIRNKKRN